ncbi:MAG: hypothetical protein ABSC41_17580 [Acidimicrobiales bacterium]|jgi:hypothetical protein
MGQRESTGRESTGREERHGGGRRVGPGRHRGGAVDEKPPIDGLRGWLSGRLPEGWFEGDPSVTVDRDEILVVGRVPAPEVPGDDEVARSAAEAGRITRFREETRDERMAIDREAQHLFGRSIAWGAEAGETSVVFTNLSVPVMTRLRQPERLVLDTLVDSGVARSRSDALAWCVKLVGSNADEWLRDLREAMEAVESVRQQGPAVS